MCHDLRTPAATIAALAEAAAVQPEVSHDVADFLARIVGQARRMAALCRYVLADAAERRPIRMDELVSDVIDAASATFDGTLKMLGEPTVIAVVDAMALWRVLVNVVDNACRVAGPDGEVVVGFARHADHIEITVADSGPGFDQVEGRPGSMGLTIVQRTARCHGWTVETRESHLGGALVALGLPVSAA